MQNALFFKNPNPQRYRVAGSGVSNFSFLSTENRQAKSNLSGMLAKDSKVYESKYSSYFKNTPSIYNQNPFKSQSKARDQMMSSTSLISILSSVKFLNGSYSI